MTEQSKAKDVLYWKAAVNAEGQLVIVDPDAKHKLGDALFTYDEAANIELQDSRPVVVAVVRAYMVRKDVIEAP